MTRERNETSSVFLSLLVVLAAVGGGLVAATGGVVAGHDSPGNYTVHLPDDSDHQTGDQNGPSASIWHLAAMADGFDDTPSQKGFEKASFLTIGSDEIDFSNCGTSNTAAFGLDRGNDDSGTTTDQDLLRHREDSQFNPDGIVVDFFDEDDFAGETVDINAEDQIVAVQNDCYEMPPEPGWYQIFGSLNGTGYDGSEFEISLESHYFYVCNCEDEAEARERLGPPPSEQGSGSESTPTPTPEPAEATPTPEPAEATATATATPTPTPAQGASTPTATPASSGDEPSPTGKSQQNDGSQQQQQQQGQQDGQERQQPQQATATAAGEAGVPVTPTIAEGPGFGAGLALVALAGAALVALRRS